MKAFCKKHLPTIVICGAFAFIMLLQLIIRNMYVAVAAFAVIGAGIMFGKKEDRLSILMFALPFSRIFKLNIGQTSLFTFLILEYIILIVLDHFIEKKPIPKKAIIPGIIYGVLGIYVLIQYAIFRQYILINRVISISMHTSLPLFYFIDVNRSNDEDKIDIIKFMIYGILVASFISLLSYVVPRIQANLYYLIDDEIGIIQGVRRFSGLFGDSNYYGFYILAVASLVVLNLKKLHPQKLYIPATIVIFVLGFLTLSMMYFLVAIVLIVFLVIQLFRAKPKIGLISTAVISVLLLLVMLIIGDKIMGIIMAKIGSLTISDITTGRTDIWIDYINYFLNNPSTIIAGHGIYASTADHFISIWGNINTAAHNSVLELLYDYGIIGGALLISYYVTCLSCYGINFKEIFKNKSTWFFLLVYIICGTAVELIESVFTPFFLLIFALSIGTLDEKEQVGLNLSSLKNIGKAIDEPKLINKTKTIEVGEEK